jgi:hypothetical protein
MGDNQVMRATESLVSVFVVWALLLAPLGCERPPGPAPLPPELPIPEDLAEFLSGVVVPGSDFEYDDPEMRRETSRPVTSAVQAYHELLDLYPRLGNLVQGWTEFEGHYVFSLAPPGLEYTVILYVPIGGREIRYFQPHT